MSNAASSFWRDGRQFPSQAQIDAAVDDLAELLALDRFGLPEMARMMGVSGGTVCVLLANLCERYGEAVAA